MGQGRTLPLLGPAIVLYLLVELVSLDVPLDGAAIVLCVLAVLAVILPASRLLPDEARGARRVAFLSIALGVGLASLAAGPVLSFVLELGAVLAWPWLGALAIDLAFEVPDQPAALRRFRPLRGVSWFGSALAALAGVMVVLPAPEIGGAAFIVPPTVLASIPLLFTVQVATAVALRAVRRRLGSSPESLAANGWALLGNVGALIGSAAFVWIASREGVGSSVARGLACGAGASLVAGHVALLEVRRPVRAAQATRRVLSAALAVGGLGVVAAALAAHVPADPVALAVTAAAFLASGQLVYRGLSVVVERLFAPDSGRLLRGLREAEASVLGLRTLEEIGAACLPPLRRASRDLESTPLLFCTEPGRALRVDAAGVGHVDKRAMPAAIFARFSESPGEVIIRAPLAAQVVRRPHLRELVDALERLDALCVAPLALDGEVEGALVVPRGRRRAAVTLEELAALERLASRLAPTIAALSAEQRAHERVGLTRRDTSALEERLELLDDEVNRLRAEQKVLKAGRVADRVSAPAIAYSGVMRALSARIAEVAPLDAPLLLLAEAGTAVEQIGHMVHASGPTREGAFVVADCASVRPERTLAALVGDESESGARPGWLRLASPGTLLLVDVPALSLEAQVALEEAIASRSAHAEGGGSPYPVDARIIATARVSLASLARNGTFHPELARRLDPLTLSVPALRERREDLPSLVLLSLDRACRTLGRDAVGIEEAALNALLQHDWHGNLRELQSVIDRAVMHTEGARVSHETVSATLAAPPAARDAAEVSEEDPLGGSWADIEKRVLRAALERAAGNKSEAARFLGLARSTFLDKLRRSGLEDEENPPRTSV